VVLELLSRVRRICGSCYARDAVHCMGGRHVVDLEAPSASGLRPMSWR
jgi:hypothetical protein